MSLRTSAFVVASLSATLGAARPASACGVSSPDGASLCAMAAGDGPKWRVGASAIYTATRIRFSDTIRGDEHRSGVLASLAYQLSPSLTFQAGLGPSLGGHYDAPDGRYQLEPGLLGLLGLSFRIYGGVTLDENGEGRNQNPFLFLTSALAFNMTQTRRAVPTAAGDARTPYEAYDLRVGVVLGVTIADRIRPYVLSRTFGGPIFWHYQGSAVTGTDLYHFQFGGGLSVALGKGFALYAEGVPLGERGVSGGAAQSFLFRDRRRGDGITVVVLGMLTTGRTYASVARRGPRRRR